MKLMIKTLLAKRWVRLIVYFIGFLTGTYFISIICTYLGIKDSLVTGGLGMIFGVLYVGCLLSIELYE